MIVQPAQFKSQLCDPIIVPNNILDRAKKLSPNDGNCKGTRSNFMYSGISSHRVRTNIFFSGFSLCYADDLMKDMGVDESEKPEYER